jgi:hypothetical protein
VDKDIMSEDRAAVAFVRRHSAAQTQRRHHRSPQYKTRRQVQAVVDAILVAEYMQVPSMVNALAKVLADWVVGLTPAHIRAQFALSDDLDRGAVDELRHELPGWTTGRERSTSTSSSDAARTIAPCREASAVGGWHDLPWPTASAVLVPVGGAGRAPRAGTVCVPRLDQRVSHPYAPSAFGQLLATCPSCATLHWAFAEASMPARWLTHDAVSAITKHPGRRALLSWLEDCSLLEGHRQYVWMGLERYGTTDDMRWADEDKRWPLYHQHDGSLAYSCEDLALQVKWVRARLLAADLKSAADPAFIFRRALDGGHPHTAAWAWDELGVRELADPSRVDDDRINMDLVDARKQLTFGAQAGRMELVCEAVEHLRGHNSYNLASVINGAATNRRMDMLEWAWQECLAHPRASYPRQYRHTGQDGAEAVSPEEEMTIGALGNITGTLLFAAMKATDWTGCGRASTGSPCARWRSAARFSGILADVWWTADRDYDAIASWALRQPDLSALSRFYELVPFQAAGLLWSAIEPDRVDLVEWCAQRSDPTCWDVLLMGSALSQKRLDLARWFYAHGVPYMVEPTSPALPTCAAVRIATVTSTPCSLQPQRAAT